MIQRTGHAVRVRAYGEQLAAARHRPELQQAAPRRGGQHGRIGREGHRGDRPLVGHLAALRARAPVGRPDRRCTSSRACNARKRRRRAALCSFCWEEVTALSGKTLTSQTRRARPRTRHSCSPESLSQEWSESCSRQAQVPCKAPAPLHRARAAERRRAPDSLCGARPPRPRRPRRPRPRRRSPAAAAPPPAAPLRAPARSARSARRQRLQCLCEVHNKPSDLQPGNTSLRRNGSGERAQPRIPGLTG